MFEILYEEKEWFVINKPAGISVHNAEDKSIIQYYDNVAPVHRLDKETSGILILSRNKAITAKLQKALEGGHKKYICICRKPFSKNSGKWTYPLTEKAQGFKSPQGPKKEQKDCLSIWRLLDKNQYFSMLEVEIKTGRTHQIRRHTLLAGYHIIGDNRYGDKKFNKKMASIYKTERMCLHAQSLEFSLDKKNITITSDIPVEFSSFF